MMQNQKIPEPVTHQAVVMAEVAVNIPEKVDQAADIMEVTEIVEVAEATEDAAEEEEEVTVPDLTDVLIAVRSITKSVIVKRNKPKDTAEEDIVEILEIETEVESLMMEIEDQKLAIIAEKKIIFLKIVPIRDAWSAIIANNRAIKASNVRKKTHATVAEVAAEVEAVPIEIDMMVEAAEEEINIQGQEAIPAVVVVIINTNRKKDLIKERILAVQAAAHLEIDSS